MLYYITDYLFLAYIAFLTFSRLLVNPSRFYPEQINNFFFQEVTYFGFGATPKIFWIGVFLLSGSIGFRILEFVLGYAYFMVKEQKIFINQTTDGEEYLEKHGIKRFEK